MKDNRGLTLVELIITIAILSIVLLSVTSFMTTGSRTFTRGNADANMQKEAQIAVNQLENMIIDVNGSMTLIEDASGDKELIMYNTDSGGAYTKDAVIYKKAEQKIMCSKWNATYDAASKTYTQGSAIYTNQLLTENVAKFEVNLSDVYEDAADDGSTVSILKSVQIKVGYKDSDGSVSYATSPIVALRNRVTKN